ncbi:hypothetical protein EDD17DRAFT_695984 [Pisolithus thermaeus]|nr:hypothetical protein EDD17DRAFT_695984 [Pisolithus thermaeus]
MELRVSQTSSSSSLTNVHCRALCNPLDDMSRRTGSTSTSCISPPVSNGRQPQEIYGRTYYDSTINRWMKQSSSSQTYLRSSTSYVWVGEITFLKKLFFTVGTESASASSGVAEDSLQSRPSKLLRGALVAKHNIKRRSVTVRDPHLEVS